MGIESITSVLQTDASPSRHQTVLVLWSYHQRASTLLQALPLRGWVKGLSVARRP